PQGYGEIGSAMGPAPPLRHFGSATALSPWQLGHAPLRLARPQQLEGKLALRPPKAAKGARELGINTVGELLMPLPFRYEDRTQVTLVRQLEEGKKATVLGGIQSIRPR